MGDITAANAAILLSIPPLFPIPQQLFGFSTDDVYDVPAIRSVEVQMGVDGILSAGFVYKEIEMEVTLQADSPSNSLFDIWWTQMEASLSTYAAQGIIKLPGISTKFGLTTGFLTSYKPAPGAGKTLKARRHGITWTTISPAPSLG